MTDLVYVVPNGDLIVRYPVTKAILPRAGATVSLSGTDGNYWRRRFLDGSIVETPKPAAPVPASAPVKSTAAEPIEKKK
jgi:hypothetical protein